MELLLEEGESLVTGASVEVVHLSPNTAKNIAQRLGAGFTEATVAERLGTRAVGLQGVITKLFLCFGSFAYEVAWVDPEGSRNGTMGILFPGEGKRIPNILVRS